MQRLHNIEPRQKLTVPVSIKISCNEGLLSTDHEKLGQLVTTFEQRRLKSLIREPGKNEEVGFYAKIKGYNARAKIFNINNYDMLAKKLKHNKQLKNIPFAVDLENKDRTKSLDGKLSAQTERIKPVVNIKEKERLKEIIKKSRFQMSPLEIKQIKDAIRYQDQYDMSTFNRSSIIGLPGLLTSRISRNDSKPNLMIGTQTQTFSKISPRLKTLYNQNSYELKDILMNKLNSSSLRDSLQQTRQIKGQQQNDDNINRSRQYMSPAAKESLLFVDTNDHITEESQSNNGEELKSQYLLEQRDLILNPNSQVYEFQIDALNDKIYFQKLEKLQSCNFQPQLPNQQQTMNMTSQGFLQDYDQPKVARKQNSKLGHQTVMRFPEVNLLSSNIAIQQTKRDEIKRTDQQLTFMLKPKYSGAVNMDINKIEGEFLEQMWVKRQEENTQNFIGKKNRISFGKKEANYNSGDLIDDFGAVKLAQAEDRIIDGIWIQNNFDGPYPSSREASRTVIMNGKMYMMFGFLQDRLKDFQVLDLRQMKWSQIPISDFLVSVPEYRINFSLVQYKNSLILFGGAGNYLSKIKQRETFNDIWMYTPSDYSDNGNAGWQELPSFENIPTKRYFHDGCIFGCVYMAFGGMTKQKEILSDLIGYDIEAQAWIKFSQPKKNKSSQIGFRFMHSLTSVMPEFQLKKSPLIHESTQSQPYQQQSPEQSTSNPLQKQVSIYSRHMWAITQKLDKFGISGIYLFGGMDEKAIVYNDVWVIKPCYKKNKDNLQNGTCEYRENFEKKLIIEIEKVETQGKPPMPRYQHQAVFFMNKYLLIHGGRNNKEAYEEVGNVALNDMAVLDLELRAWSIISMIGDIPSSRWGHCMAAEKDQLYIFGGKNLLNFANASMYTFIVNKKQKQREMERIKEKHESNRQELKKYKFSQ